MWLQEALQIHPRLAFRSAVEAQRSFADISSRPGSRRAGAMALQVLLRTTLGEPVAQHPPAFTQPMPPPPPAPQPQAPPPTQQKSSPFDSILRSVFPKH
jgi:hypothetical protein